MTVVASAVLAADYWFVYRPLQDSIIPLGQPRTSEFTQLHNWSRNVNALHLLIVLVAAILSSLPVSLGTAQTPRCETMERQRREEEVSSSKPNVADDV